MEGENQRNKKSGKTRRNEDKERSKYIQTSMVWVFSLLLLSMDNIKNLKLKGLKVVICYHFRSEKLKGVPNKLELAEAVTDMFLKDYVLVVHRKGGGRSVVKN